MSKLLMQRVTWRVMALIGFESVLILSAVLLGTYLRLGTRPFEQGASRLALKGLLIAGVCQLCLYYGDLYNSRLGGDRRELYVRILRSLGATSLVLAALYFWLPELIIGRGVFMIAATLVIVSVVTWRASFEWFAKQVGPRERLLLVGTSPAALSLASELRERNHLGVEVVGFVDTDTADRATAGAALARRGQHRRHSRDRREPIGGSGGGESVGRARPASDGRTPDHEAPGGHVRPSRIGVRGVHGEDRR